MVHDVVVLERRITDRVLPMVLRKPAVVEGASGSVEECAVYALREAVFLWSIYGMVGEWLVLCPVYVWIDVAERYPRALSVRNIRGWWPV